MPDPVPRPLVIAVGAAALLATPGSADAATAGIAPTKACYRSGESVLLAGGGYTPNSFVRVTSSGRRIGTLDTSAQGIFAGLLRLHLGSGERVKRYAAVDAVNPALTASRSVRVSAVAVSVRPRSGRPGRRLRIRARGFTTGRRLYAHVVRRRYRRNVRVGRLRHACHRLRGRRRVFSSRTRPGVYRVQFDTRRRYSRRTKVRIRFRVRVFRTSSSAVAGAASVGGRWVRTP